MTAFDKEIQNIRNEVADLKIFKSKKAGILRTNITNFDVDFTLYYNSDTQTAESDLVYLLATPSANMMPIASIEFNDIDLNNRNISCSMYPIQTTYNSYLFIGMSVSSNNSSDILAVQGGGTLKITMNFNIVGTSNFTITNWI